MNPSDNNTETPPDPRIAFFDSLAENWDAGEQNPAETLAAFQRRANLLELRRGENLLEIGCGTGQLTSWLAEQVMPGRVVAVDFSAAMLQQARQKGIAAEFHAADVCVDPLGNGEFDIALCFHSFPHFRDKPAALANIARSLKSGGRLIVMHLHGRAEINAFHSGAGGTIGSDLLPDDRQWRKLLTATGFSAPLILDGEEGFFLRAILSRPR
jgi:ubiquinone/menaquinone biosynthesis C-methylase UbiE